MFPRIRGRDRTWFAIFSHTRQRKLHTNSWSPHNGEAFFISIQLFVYMINFLRNFVYEDFLISEEPCYRSRTCNSDQLPGKRIDNSILIYVFIESLRFQPHILPVSYVKSYIDYSTIISCIRRDIVV